VMYRLLRRGDTRIQLPGVAGLRGRGFRHADTGSAAAQPTPVLDAARSRRMALPETIGGHPDHRRRRPRLLVPHRLLRPLPPSLRLANLGRLHLLQRLPLPGGIGQRKQPAGRLWLRHRGSQSRRPRFIRSKTYLLVLRQQEHLLLGLAGLAVDSDN